MVAGETTAMVHREPLQLLLLGKFSLKRGVQPIGSLPKKAQALLAYLALHRGRSFARERLATLLWGHSGSEQARRSLRQCLMSVRSALDASADEVLIADGDQVMLSIRDCIEVDVTRFTAFGSSSKLDELRAASEIYRDQFLDGMQVAAEPFADWVEVERRRFSSMMSDVLHRLAVAEAEAGRNELAIKTAEQLTRSGSAARGRPSAAHASAGSWRPEGRGPAGGPRPSSSLRRASKFSSASLALDRSPRPPNWPMRSAAARQARRYR